MKIPLCAALVVAWQIAAPAAETTHTAYDALRVVGKHNGADALNQVLEVRGRFGSPEPDTWRITLADPSAQGGIRELEVQNGHIVSEKTPVSRALNGKMNFNQLNLDSEGVFTVVNQAAQKAAVTFDRVDYSLRSGVQGGAPVWHVDLFSGNTGRVGEFDVAADSGTVLKTDFNHKDFKAPVDDHAFVQNPPVPPARVDVPPRRLPPPPPDDARRYPDDPRRYADDGRRYPEGDRPYADAPRGVPADDDFDDPPPSDGRPLLDKIGNHFEKRSRQFKNFFTGRGWTDQ